MPSWCSQRHLWYPVGPQTDRTQTSADHLAWEAHRGLARGGDIFSTSWPSKLVQNSWEFLKYNSTTKILKDDALATKLHRHFANFQDPFFFLGVGGQLPILYIPRTSKYPYKSCFTPDITSSYFCLAILQGRLKHLDQQPIDHMHRHKAWPLSSGARLSDHHAEIWGSSSKLRSCGALLPWISCQVNHGSSCEVL